MNGISKKIWTKDMIEYLKEYYPSSSNSIISKNLGMSVFLIQKKANELGITKEQRKQDLAYSIQSLLPDHSYKEISDILGISYSHVQRIIKSNSLIRTKIQETAIRSRIRTRLVKSERRKMLFGLDVTTNLKISSKISPSKFRTKFKALGYICFYNSMTLYYDTNTSRNIDMEIEAMRTGFTFSSFDDSIYCKK